MMVEVKFNTDDHQLYYQDPNGSLTKLDQAPEELQEAKPEPPKPKESSSSSGAHNPALAKIVKAFEGFFSKAYKDPVGIWTIGYGTIKYADGTKVKPGDTITEDKAINEMVRELEGKWSTIKPYIKVPLNDNQVAAILSFSYNCGSGAFLKSSILQCINARDFKGAKNSFMKWINAGGKPFKGLWRRRLAEAMLFSGDSRIPTKVPNNFASIKYFPADYESYI